MFEYNSKYIDVNAYFRFFCVRVTVEVKRLGGGFGAKIDGVSVLAAVCGFAAYVTNRCVHLK